MLTLLVTKHKYDDHHLAFKMPKNISSMAVLIFLIASASTVFATPAALSQTTTTTTSTASSSTPPASTSTTVTCASSSIVIYHGVICTATVTGSFPLGKVTWSDGGVQKLSRTTCTLFIGSCSVVFRPMSSTSPVTITASYAGDHRNAPSSGSFSVTVSLKGSVTKVYCWPNQIATGSANNVTCVGRVIGHNPTGTLTWTQTGTGTVTFITSTCLLAKSHCSVTLLAGSTGNVAIQAAYNGDANNSASSGSAQLMIKAKTSLANVCSATSVAVGSSMTCTATLTDFTGSVSGESIVWYVVGGTGSVTLSSGSCALSSGGSCSITVTGSVAGSVAIRAFYLGDSANTRSAGSARIMVS